MPFNGVQRGCVALATAERDFGGDEASSLDWTDLHSQHISSKCLQIQHRFGDSLNGAMVLSKTTWRCIVPLGRQEEISRLALFIYCTVEIFPARAEIGSPSG